jgi:hypothetical protein
MQVFVVPALVRRGQEAVCPLPWRATFMADDKPEPTPMTRVTAAMDEIHGNSPASPSHGAE